MFLPPLSEAHHRVQDHIRKSTTDSGDELYRSPVEAYLSRQVFQDELNRVVKRRPLPFLASTKLAKPGDFFTGELCGISLLAVRDENNRARVFLNTCRHRGAKLETSREGCGRRSFQCPFHGWTYRLSGGLAHIPAKDKCFKGDEKLDFALQEIPSLEQASLIWVLLERDGAKPMERHFTELIPDFSLLGYSSHYPLHEFNCVTQANWKIAVEGFLEGYHFQYAHKKILADMKFPNLSLTDFSGENARVIVPLRDPAEGERVPRWGNILYFIFPCTFLLAYDDHFALIAFVPLSPDKTYFWNMPMAPIGAGAESIEAIKFKATVVKEIVKEDFVIEEAIQLGLGSGANREFTFTRLEHALAEFHRNLGRAKGQELNF